MRQPNNAELLTFVKMVSNRSDALREKEVAYVYFSHTRIIAEQILL